MEEIGEQCKITYADTDSIMIILPGPVEQNGTSVKPTWLKKEEVIYPIEEQHCFGGKKYNTITK